jgi:hypothetical protein
VTRTLTRTSALALSVGLLAGTLAACGSGDDERQAAPTAPPVSTSAPSTTGPTTPTASEPAFPADTQADEGGTAGGGKLGVTDIRVARQDGYDRVVFELAGTGAPGWRVAYTATPTLGESGERAQVDGDVYLQVFVRGVGYPMDTGVTEYAGANPIAAGGTTSVRAVRHGAVFEGQYDAIIGISGTQRPFRAFTLTNPTRLVVDVRDN